MPRRASVAIRRDGYSREKAAANLDELAMRVARLEGSMIRSLILLEALTDASIASGGLTASAIEKALENIDVERVMSMLGDEPVKPSRLSPEDYLKSLEPRATMASLAATESGVCIEPTAGRIQHLDSLQHEEEGFLSL